MQHGNALAAPTANLAAQVRDTLVLNESHIVELVNEVLACLPKHEGELFKRQLSKNSSLGAAIRRVVVDIGVVLTLAKCFELDDEFSDAASLIHDIDFFAHDGLVGAFAKAMVECDLKSVTSAQGEDAVFYDLLPAEALERRIRLILAFMDQVTKRAH